MRSEDYGVSFNYLFDINTYGFYAVTSEDGKYVLTGKGKTEIDAASYGGKLWMSSNYGISFTEVLNTSTIYKFNTGAISGNNKYMIACIYCSGWYLSTNYGVSWTIISGLPTGSPENYAEGDSEISYDGKYMMCNTRHGVWVSNNFGINGSWIFTTIAGAVDAEDCCMSYSGKYMYLLIRSATALISRSSNYGVTWATVTGTNYYGIDCDWSGQYLVSAKLNDSNIYFSVDFGATWAILKATLDNIRGIVMSFDCSRIQLSGTNSQWFKNLTNSSSSVITHFSEVNIDKSLTINGGVSCTTLTTTGAINTGTNAITGGTLSCSSIINSGTLSCAGVTTTGAINAGTNAIGCGSITSSGIFSNGANAMTCGALSCSSVTVTGNVDGVDISAFKTDYDSKISQELKTTSVPTFANMTVSNGYMSIGGYTITFPSQTGTLPMIKHVNVSSGTYELVKTETSIFTSGGSSTSLTIPSLAVNEKKGWSLDLVVTSTGGSTVFFSGGSMNGQSGNSVHMVIASGQFVRLLHIEDNNWYCHGTVTFASNQG